MNEFSPVAGTGYDPKVPLTGMSLDHDSSWQMYARGYLRTHRDATEHDIHVLADGYQAGKKQAELSIQAAFRTALGV